MHRNKVFIACAISWILFWPVGWFVPRLYLFDLVNALSVSFCVFVLWAYYPGIIAGPKEPGGFKRQHYLIFGIVATWIAMGSRTIWLWAWRYAGEPEGALDHLTMAFVAWLVVTGGAFHLVAPRVIDGKVPDV